LEEVMGSSNFKTLVTLAWLIFAAIAVTSGSALQKDDSFIVALKTDNSISDYDPMQNDEVCSNLRLF